ncbi:hypothetical protein OIU76_030282 [Salix suchowensis]|nr:hypothetical protein OIU76_030282 [Salix suchowensis]
MVLFCTFCLNNFYSIILVTIEDSANQAKTKYSHLLHKESCGLGFSFHFIIQVSKQLSPVH